MELNQERFSQSSEDIKKLERRVKREEKKLAEQSGKLTNE